MRIAIVRPARVARQVRGRAHEAMGIEGRHRPEARCHRPRQPDDAVVLIIAPAASRIPPMLHRPSVGLDAVLPISRAVLSHEHGDRQGLAQILRVGRSRAHT